MWGKRKIAKLLERDGLAASVSTVGRILSWLVARGAIVPVPILRRRPGGRRIRLTQRQRYAQQKARRTRPNRHAVCQLASRPALKHFTAYDPVAKWTLGTSPPTLPPAP
jgi:putative transposase